MMLVNVRFLLKYPDLITDMYLDNRAIKNIRYTSYEQQQKKMCSIIFDDNTNITVRDNQDIQITKMILVKK